MSKEDKPKHAGGRPRILKSLEEAQAKIDNYFSEDNKDHLRPTISGLALWLGFDDRQSIRDYIGRNDGYSCLIKRAVARIEAIHEGRMYDAQCVGSIFWLKNRGWSDKCEVAIGVDQGAKDLMGWLAGRDKPGT